MKIFLEEPLQQFILMNVLALILSFATLLVLVSGSEISIFPGNFYQIKGLVKHTKFNDSYALVLGGPNENGRVSVLAPIISKIMNSSNEDSGDFNSEDYFAEILIKPENLVSFNWNRPEILSEIEAWARFNTSGVYRRLQVVPLTEEEIKVLEGIMNLLRKLINSDISKYSTDDAIIARVRVIGVMICQTYGYSSFAYVSENDPSMHPFLPRAWDIIRKWLKQESH